MTPRLGNLPFFSFPLLPSLSLLICNPHSAIQCRSFSLSHNHMLFSLSLFQTPNYPFTHSFSFSLLFNM